MSDDPITLSREDAQRIFDLAVGADSACSGYMDSDDVAAMRRLAVAIGVDPAECTGPEFTTQFPHAYQPGHPDLAEYARIITVHRTDTANGRSITITRAETAEEVLARLGGTIPEQCIAGRWRGRCGKSADDPIHAVNHAAAEHDEMTSEVETIGTEPPELLDAMLAMIRRKGCDAVKVTGYRERSYNIGYCETCSEMVTDVRIFYVKADGSEAHYQAEYTDLGELIRQLTDDPGRRQHWNDTAKRETQDERIDRWGAHAFDEETGE
jgi:hypothetical protein